MADIQYSEGHSSDYGYEYGYEDAGAAAPVDTSRVTQLVNWAGAIVSMGLVIGMAIWAWQLLMRDVTEVPVIRALEGPMRIAPTDPGGAVAENQGLAVNRLAEGEEAAPVPDRLVLAPPPIDLDAAPEEAFTNGSIAEAVIEPEEDQTIAFDVDVDADPAAAEEAAAAAAADTDALITRLLQEAQPLEPVEGSGLPNMADAPADATPDVIARAQTIPISIPGVRRSPRPVLRPETIAARAPAPVVDGAPAPEGVVEDETGFEIAPTDLETGTRLVQLGAFDSPELARAEWQRLSGVFPDFFLGRARVIEEASSGGQTFYRLRAHGFADLSASRRFCAALVAQGAACIPVTVR